MAIKRRNLEVVDNNPAKMSIFELVKQLEKGAVNPASLSKDALRKCADVYKARGYSNSQIAEILNVDDKTVQRYIKQQREENSLTIGDNFQKNMVGEIIRNWRNQYQRLIKLSYSDDLTPNEIMKAIYFGHQVEKDGVELLERLGYLTKEVFAPEYQQESKIIVIKSGDVDVNKFPAFQNLSTEQKEQIVKMMDERNEVARKINKMMKDLTGEEIFYIPSKEEKKI